MEVVKALEILRDIPLKTESESDRNLKVKAIRAIDEKLTTLRNANDFHALLSVSIQNLLRLLQDSDMNVWSLAEQALVKIIKVLNRTHHEYIIYEIWRGMKGSKGEGRARRFAIELFSLHAHRIQHVKVDQFRQSLLKNLVAITKEHKDQLLQEALSKHIEPIIQYQLANAPLNELTPLLDELTCNISSPHSRVRRSAAHCLALACRYHQQRYDCVRATVDRMYQLIILSANRARAEQAQAQQQASTSASESGKGEKAAQSSEQAAKPAVTSPPTFTVDNIIEASAAASTYVLQGVLHCLRQLLRTALEFNQPGEFINCNPMLAHIVRITEMSVECLKSDDNNVIVTSLELLHDILKYYWSEVSALCNSDAIVEELVKRFDLMLFGGKRVRVSVQVLVVSCSSQLALWHAPPFRNFLKTKINGYMELLKHSDPLLRGEAYYFVGCLVAGYLSRQAQQQEPWDLDVYSLLWTVLHSIMKDESAIAAKMACQALAMIVEPLLASHYAFFVPVMLQYLMCLPSNAYLLLKSKVLSLLSKCDFRMIQYLEEAVRDFKARNPGVVVPEQLTLGQNPLQTEVVDFVISFLDDNDHRIRHKAGKVLVRLIPQLHYSHYFDNSSTRKSAVYKRILDVQTSQHMSRSYNNHFKEPTDWLLWRMIGKMNQSVDSVFLKGFYHFLRQLLEEGYPLPGQFVSIILDQLACSSLATDIEAQLDIVVMASHLVQHLTGDMAVYIGKIFVHLVRLLNILTGILQGKPIPTFKESRPGANEGLIGSVQGQPQYLQLWDRLRDTYRVSLTSLQPNLFDSLCHETLIAIARVVKMMGKSVIPHIDELLEYLPEHIEKEAHAVVTCVHALLAASLSNVDPTSTQPRTPDVMTEPSQLGALPAQSSPTSIVELVTPTFDYLLHSPSAAQFGYSNSAQREIVTAKRRLQRSFETMFSIIIDLFDKVQSQPLKRAIMKALGCIVEHDADYAAIDRDYKFVRFLHQNILRLFRPTGMQIPSKHALAIAIGDMCASEVAFLYLIHFRAAVTLSGSFLLTNSELSQLLPVAFIASWSPENYQSFVDIANVLFLENLEERLKLRRKEAERLKMKKAPANKVEEQEEDRMDAALAHDLRKEFVARLLALLPDRNAIKLITLVIATLKRFSDLNQYTEFSAQIAAKLQQLVTESHLLAKVSIDDIYLLFDVIDQLPQDTFDLRLLCSALLSHAEMNVDGITSTSTPLQPVEAGKRPDLWEKRVYQIQGRAWLPQTIVLFRILLKFPESDILYTVERLLSPGIRDDDIQKYADVVAQSLVNLLHRAATPFCSRIPYHLEDTWSRLSALLVHFVVYFVDASRQSKVLRASLRKQLLSQVNDTKVTEILKGFLESLYSGCCFIFCKLCEKLELPEYIESLLLLEDKRTWSWHSEVLKSYCCVLLARTHNVGNLHHPSSQILANEKFLEVLTRQINDKDVAKLLSSSSAEVQETFLKYIEGRMAADAKLEMMSPQNVHELLLTLCQLPPTEYLLEVLFKYFASNGHISVQIACEHYLLNLMNQFHISQDDTTIDDSTLKKVIEEHKDKLRPSFVRRLRKMHWLRLVSLSQQDLPSLASHDGEAQPKDTSSTSDTSTDSKLDENMEKLIASTSLPGDRSELDSSGDHARSKFVPGSSLDTTSFIKYFYNRDNSNHLKIIQTLCAVIPISRRLFLKILQSPLMQPYFLSYALVGYQVNRVKEPILQYLNDEIRKWLEKTSSANTPYDANTVSRGTGANATGTGVDTQQIESEITKIKTKFRMDLVLANAGTSVKEWRATLELVGLIALTLHRFGSEWPTGNRTSQSHSSDDTNATSSTPHAQSPAQSPVQSPASSPPSPSPIASQLGDTLSEGGPYVFLEREALLTVATIVLERLLFLHERKVTILSSFDFVVVLSLLRQLFEVFEFSADTFKTMDNARRLLYHLYELYFILYKPDGKEILDYSSFDQVDTVFNFFWFFLRERPWLRADAGLIAPSRGQESFALALQALAQSSASIELLVYPLLGEPINFDSHNEPVHLLKHFVLLINTMHPEYPSVFQKVWDNLFSGLDPNIPPVATSAQIKALTLRGLTHLLLRAGFKANKWPTKWLRLDDNGNVAIEHITVDLNRIRNPDKEMQWLGFNLSALLEDLINVMSGVLEDYKRGKMSELQYLLECLRSIVLLSDLFNEQQFQWMLDAFLQIAEAQMEPWEDDAIAKQYLVLGICKAAAVLHTMLPTSADNKNASQYLTRIQKILRFQVQNMKMRESEIHDEKKTAVPYSSVMLLLSLYFLLESTPRVLDFKKEDEICKWILQVGADQRTTSYARNLARTCWSKLTADTVKKDGHEDGEVELKFIEEVKNLFIRIRKSPLVHVERLAKSMIPAKLVTRFNYDQIMSLLLGELARPEPGVHNIALILYHVLSKLKQDKASDIHKIMIRWILMCLTSFVQLSATKGGEHASWALTALFLAASTNPLQRILFFDLIAEPDLYVDEKILQLAGVDFYCNQQLDLASKRDLIAALSDMKGDTFSKLLRVLRHLYASDEAREAMERELRTGENGDVASESPQAST